MTKLAASFRQLFEVGKKPAAGEWLVINHHQPWLEALEGRWRPSQGRAAGRPGSEPQTSSIATAVASPPPMHSEATPRLPPVFCRALIRVTISREPVEPTGCPWAQAPPKMFTLE